jgi:Flp pilus assembly protein TadB
MTTMEARDTRADQKARRDRDETEKERLDRNMTELVGELRVALPGVQVLFAFLLTVPFNQRFSQVTSFDETIYLITLLSTAVATALLLAPSALHRIEFRQDDKEHIVRAANRYAIAGFAALMVAVTGAVLLVTHFLYSDTTAYIATIAVGVLLVLCWYVMPTLRRLRNGRSPQTGRTTSRRRASATHA